MGKLKGYIDRWKLCQSLYGVKYTIRKTIARLINKITHSYLVPDPTPPALPAPSTVDTTYDVLIISGCSETIAPQCYRYRVLHQREQLEATGLSVKDFLYTNFSPYEVTYANIVIYYRCPYTEGIGESIRLAKKLNKRVLYDIDDLVVDTCYTDTILAVQQMSRGDRALYDEGVCRMGATLRMCEYAVTTTERLQTELRHYVPEVFINRNRASQMMLACSERGLAAAKQKSRKAGEVILGYFSGTLTHNADFELIKASVLRLLDNYPNVKLSLVGELALPQELKKYAKRIIMQRFVDWKKLPEVIASVDINLAPLENTIFNEAKSENKWVEASLVKVPTVASNVGAFQRMIEDGRTGVLCNDDEWYDKLKDLVVNVKKRQAIAEAAYKYCKEHYSTIANAGTIRNIYEQVRAKRIAFVLPSAEISGGIMVALYHACFLQDAGWDVEIMVPYRKVVVWEIFDHTLPCISFRDCNANNTAHYDVMVATMWTTVDYVMQYRNVDKRAYLVQNYETDFYKYSDATRLESEATYYIRSGLHYLTISKWCSEWLSERFQQEPVLMQNGINLAYFQAHKRNLSGKKIRILIEGDCAVAYKGVDESFKIAEKLDRNRFEVWYMSYNAEPKEEYHLDKFLHAVPYAEVGKVYEECDILLKSSWLESFSYPPLEMMATGGYCVVVPNGGNQEYLVDGENCLFYERGNLDAAVSAITRLVGDCKLQNKLYANGLKTARNKDWLLLKDCIVETYNSLVQNDINAESKQPTLSSVS